MSKLTKAATLARQMLRTAEPFENRLRLVCIAVAAEFMVPIHLIVGHKHHARLVEARHIAIGLCRELCPDVSTGKIAQEFGRDSASVRYAVKRYGEMKAARRKSTAALAAKLGVSVEAAAE